MMSLPFNEPLPEFDTIVNFRRPSKRIKLYRYAALDHARPDEVALLFEACDITHRVDLRSPLEVLRSQVKGPLVSRVGFVEEEGVNAKEKMSLLNFAPLGKPLAETVPDNPIAFSVVQNKMLFGASGSTYPTMGVTREDPVQTDMSIASSIVAQFRPWDASRLSRYLRQKSEKITTTQNEFYNVPIETMRSAHPSQFRTSDKIEPDIMVAPTTRQRRVHVTNVNFMNMNYINHVVWNRATLREKWQSFWFMFTFRIESVIVFVGKKLLARGGLLGSYNDFLQYSGKAVFSALSAVTVGLESGSGVGVNCQYCKDRSGITVALIRYVIGDSKEDIFKDYNESERGLFPWREEMIKAFVSQGLDPSWVMAPYDVMRDLFEFIESTFGSVNTYLDDIGFDISWRQRLCAVADSNETLAETEAETTDFRYV